MKERDLTKGSIFKNILIVSIPLIIASMVNMLYNFTDMFWISQIGPEGVSAVGTTALFIWMASSLMLIVNMGTQIEISYAVGEGNKERVQYLVNNSMKFSLVVGLIFGVIQFVFANQLINFFDIDNTQTYDWAVSYLRVCSVFIVTTSINQTFSAIYNGLGNTMAVLVIMCIGMILNMFLDPLFIHILQLDVTGAGLATVFSSIISMIIFIGYTVKTSELLSKIKDKVDFVEIKKISKLGLFPTIQNVAFAGIAMVITKYVSAFGDEAIAIQRVGNDIESLTWMIGLGISTAISVFIGQNIAAKEYKRVHRASLMMLGTMFIYGLLITILFFVADEQIYGIFFDDASLISLGKDYLMFAAFAQIPMIIESTITGIFNGYQKTNIAPFFSITGNIIRIPMAVYFGAVMGLNGVWLALAISSIYKGLGMAISMIYLKLKGKLY